MVKRKTLKSRGKNKTRKNKTRKGGSIRNILRLMPIGPERYRARLWGRRIRNLFS